MHLFWRHLIGILTDVVDDVRAGWLWLLCLASIGWGSVSGLLLLPEYAGPYIVQPPLLPYANVFIVGFYVAVTVVLIAGSIVIGTILLRSAVGRRFEGFHHDRFWKDMLRTTSVGLSIALVAGLASVATTWAVFELASALIAGAGDDVGHSGLGENSGLNAFESDFFAFVDMTSIVLGAIVTGWVLARLLPALAATVALRRIVLFGAWRWTAGRWAPAFVLLAAIWVPAELLLANAMNTDDPDWSVYVAAFGSFGLRAAIEMLISVALWRRVSPNEVLEAAAWRPVGDNAVLLPLPGYEATATRTTS